jgi:hypothetical protein
MPFDKREFAGVFANAFIEVAMEVAPEVVRDVAGADHGNIDLTLVNLLRNELRKAAWALGTRSNLLYRGSSCDDTQELVCMHMAMQRIATRIQIVVQGHFGAFVVRLGPPLYVAEPNYSNVYHDSYANHPSVDELLLAVA